MPKKFEIRVRDCYEKFVTTHTVKAESVEKAIWQLRQKTIGWGNCFILDVYEITKLARITHYFFPQFKDFDREGNLRKK